jgi:hypothetical protein
VSGRLGVDPPGGRDRIVTIARRRQARHRRSRQNRIGQRLPKDQVDDRSGSGLDCDDVTTDPNVADSGDIEGSAELDERVRRSGPPGERALYLSLAAGFHG